MTDDSPTGVVTTAGLPNLSWALESLNLTGVAGRKVVLEYIAIEGQDLAVLGKQVAEDDRYVAAIAPPGSDGLSQVAEFFLAQHKPVVATTSASDDLLRAYGGKGAIWRTRQSDVAQTELLLRFAQQGQAHRVALVTSVDTAGATFFSWFGFFARELGFAESDVTIVALTDGEACDARVQQALAANPDMLFVAANAPEDQQCVVKALAPSGSSSHRPRVVIADTGLDPYELESLGATAVGIEGFNSAGPESFEQAFRKRFGQQKRLAPHGASEYDAVLLLGYGLEVSKGEGGTVLVDALKQVVDGTETNTFDWQGAGTSAALKALSEGKRPALTGATGPLKFDPSLYMDLASSTLSHWTMKPEGLTVDQRYSTSDPTFLSSQGTLVKPSGGLASAVPSSTWEPSTGRTDTWAVVAALSADWSNYRHQSDALQQYQLLRASGIADDHIVLIQADDIASSPSNPLEGEVRNDADGADIYGGRQLDYTLTISSDDLVNILSGHVTDRTPTVIQPTASSNVYIYLVGHGGTAGIPLSATSTSAGLSGEGDVFSPTQLRQALCSLRSEQRMRRALVVIESCYSGAFGDTTYGGLEQGCDADSGSFPLEGVTMLTAANSREVSFAGTYDTKVRSWVNDSFSRHLVTRLVNAPGSSVGDLYADVYQQTAGSHASVYNSSHDSRLTDLLMTEFFSP